MNYTWKFALIQNRPIFISINNLSPNHWQKISVASNIPPQWGTWDLSVSPSSDPVYPEPTADWWEQTSDTSNWEIIKE